MGFKNLLLTVCSISIISSAIISPIYADTSKNISKIDVLGGSAADEFKDIKTTNDGGYITVGSSNSTNLGFTNNGSTDGIITKYDKDGNMQWIKNFGGSGIDYFLSVDIDTDGNFITAGYSASTDAGFSSKGGICDAIIVKYDKDGNKQWVKNFGGSGADYYMSVKATRDGGYIVVGESASTNAGFTNKGSSDSIIVKYNKDGNREWIKSFGGSNNESFNSIILTSDSNFIAVGNSASTNAGFNNNGVTDAIIVKYDESGNQQWVKNWGGTKEDIFYSIIESNNDEFIACGYTTSTDTEITNNGSRDAIIVKYTTNGNQQWVKNWGGTGLDYFESITTVPNNGFIAAGHSRSDNIGFNHKGAGDSALVKYDENGNVEWVRNWGGSSQDYYYSVIAIDSNNVIAVGKSKSTDANIANHGDFDATKEHIEFSPPHTPAIKFDSNSKKITIIADILNDEVKDIKYRINNSEWMSYTGAFEPLYNEDGLCNIEVKCINVFNLESSLGTLNIKQVDIVNDISISFNQPNTLAVTLSSNSVDFGDITGLENIEKNNAISVTITSSAPYNIKIKAIDDITGVTDSTNIIDISKLKVSLNTQPYQEISKSYINLLSNEPKGIDILHRLNFNLSSTLGAKSDSYSVPIKLKASQL